MLVYWQCLLVAFALGVTSGSINTKAIRSISSGSSFGMCRGYCQQAINVTSSPTQLVASKRSNNDQVAYPSVRKQFPYSSTQWKNLLALVNLSKFQALSDTVGCPDCADGGAEWIQMNWANGSKRVTFEFGKTLKGNEKLVGKLREIREEYLARI